MPLEVINVLACASLLSLDGLITQCAQVMRENVNSESVLAYHEASLIYGVKQVEEDTLKWLCQNLMNGGGSVGTEMIKVDSLSLNLFEKIISSDQLFIIQVETDLYSLCKKWLYFQLNGPQVVSTNLTPKDFNDFFNSYRMKHDSVNSGADKSLLEIPELEKYAKIFKKIRLHNLLNDLSSYELIKQDMIVPMKWLEPCFVENWLNIIFVDQNKFSHEFEIDKASFDVNCLRFGRVLSNESNVTWRWVFMRFYFSN